MSSLISELSKEIDKLKAISSCAKCADNQDLKRLANCGHLICTACFNSAASKCPVCRISIRRRDSLQDSYLQDILTNIQNLSYINKPEKDILHNFEYPHIVPFFAPESTINKRDHKGETRLHKDCRDGNTDKVAALLQTGVDVNVQDFAGWTALHEAVTANKINVIKLLLDYGAFPSVPGLNYTTPLHTAVQENNVPVAKLLVEYGADLTCFNKDGKTPVLVAISVFIPQCLCDKILGIGGLDVERFGIKLPTFFSDLCSHSDEMRAAVCLTPRRCYLYKVYTIPQPKVFFINTNNDDIQKLSQIPGVNFATERAFLNTGDVTYVIVGKNKFNIKHLQAAMLQGSCIVTTKWIGDFLTKKSTVNPMDYTPDIHGYALSEAMMNMFNKLPKLFDGLCFYFCHTNVQKIGGYKYSVDDFKALVLLGGGKVLTRRPARLQDHDVYYPYHANKDNKLATTTYYLIYDETKRMATESHLAGLKYKSAKWLVKCINNFSIKI